MFSNYKFQIIVVFAFMWLTSCGLKIGEKVQDDRSVKISSTECLDESLKSMKRIFKAQARDAEVAPALNCLSTTIQAFTTSIKGANKDYFTRQELVYFLNKNIITQGTQIPDSLAYEIMKIKVSVLGGDKDQLTKAELGQLRRLIDQMTPYAIELNKHMDIIVSQWDYTKLSKDDKERRFNQAHVALTTFTDQLFLNFSKTPTEYDINSGIDLIKEFMTYGEASIEQIQAVENYRAIAVAVKKNVVGDPTALIKNGDWPVVSKALSSTLFFIQRHAYFMQADAPDYEFSNKNKVSRYGLMAQDIAAAVYEVLDMQGDRIVTHEQIAETFNIVFKVLDMKLTITTATMKDISILKNALIDVDTSDEVSAWNKNDFKLLTTKLSPLLREVGMILTTIDQMDQNAGWKTDYAIFNQKEVEFVQSIDTVVAIFEGRYDLQYMRPLLISLNEAGLIKDTNFIAEFDKYYNLIVNSKKLITSVGGTSLKANDLKNLISLSGRGYFHYLEYENYLKPVEFKNEKFAALALNLIPKVKATLTDALKYNVTGFLSTENLLQTYFSACADLKLIPILSEASLQVAFKTLWSNILIDADRRISGQILPGFNQEALNNLYTYVKLLLMGNKLGAEIFQMQAHPSQSQLISAVQDRAQKTSDSTELQILKEMKAAFSSPVPLTAQDGLLKILDDSPQTYSYSDMQTSNLVRVAARLTTLSYATTLYRVQLMDQLESQLTLLEMQTAFDQIKSILYEKDLVNPEIVDFMGKRFQDANLFVARSNGDDFMSFLEFHDLALHLISGSIRAKKTHDYIYSHCLTPEALPLNRKTEIYDLCLLEAYYLFDKGFEFLPRFTDQKVILGATKHYEYSYNLLLAAGLIRNEKQIVHLDDVDNYPHIVQYIEMLYAKFDADRNGELVKEEALQAFPTFKNLIKKVVTSMDGGSKIKEDQYPGVFIYFLKNGRGPKNIIEKLEFMSFISNEKKWEVHATRVDVAIVFAFIADSGAKK